jgi:WD40 repeat protein
VEGDPVTAFKASDKNLSSAALSPDGDTLATAGLGDDIHLWSMPSCQLLDTLSGHETAVGSLQYIDQGSTLVSVGYEGTIRFWDTTAWVTRRSLADSFDNIKGVAFSPDERLMAVSTASHVRMYGTESLSLQYEIPVTTKVINGIAFSPDGRWLALGAADKKIRIWEMDIS